MIPALRRVLLSLVLLGAAGLILLLSDLHARSGVRKPRGGQPPGIRVAVLKHASNLLLDEVETGLFEQLASQGYADGGRLLLQRFCAEGDLPTANAIAQRMTDGSFRLAISISTLSLQCVANANKQGRALHVFGAVTDPVGSGVGIEAIDSTNKPPWLTGIGSFQPVESTFRELKRLWPELGVVGVVWNPAERNAEACVEKARAFCPGLRLDLVEATVDASKDVPEAALSLIARGAQILWIGFDVTVSNAAVSLIETALNAHIPVVSNSTRDVQTGALFGLGANYEEVGRRLGAIAALVLDGANPAAIAVTNFMPERMTLNRKVLKQLRDPWHFPEDIVSRAELIIGENGQVEKQAVEASVAPRGAGATASSSLPPGASGPPLDRHWQLVETSYLESVMVEDAMRGFRVGLGEAGLKTDVDYSIRTLCAQGDMAALGTLFHSAKTTGVDLFVVYGTPTLQVAIKQALQTPIVFTVVADPVVAGAGKSDGDHLPNLTGVYTLGAYREMAELLHQHFPRFRRVGTLFCPAEVNSVANKDLFVQEASRQGVTVEAMAANSASELPDAALALCARPLDAIVQVIDNTCVAGFPAIARAAAQAHLPLFAHHGAAIQQGAALVLARDYYEAGRETALKAARIMRGADPAHIPLSPPRTTQKLVNLAQVRAIGLTLPDALLRDATQVTGSAHPK